LDQRHPSGAGTSEHSDLPKISELPISERIPRAAAWSGGESSPQSASIHCYPLSFAQERLWFLDQLEPENPFYHIAELIEWKGPLSLHALRKALDALVARHESLRTVFQNLEGVPMQVVTPPRTVPCEVIDLRGFTPDPDELGRRLEEEARRPFDLSRDLMLRATLLEVDEDEYRLLLVIHHIATDGWSMGVLLRELGALYEAFRNGQPARLPDLPIQYRDFAQWQREWLQGEVLEKQLGYWRERLRGAPAVLQLWTDHPRPSQPTRSGARQAVVFSESLTASLAELGKQEGASLFMTLLAAFLVLLHRYTGQTDLCVGTPIANRTRAETEGLIGFFVNTLVLRTDLSGDPSFRELLRRTREVALEAYAHQDLPFQNLVEALQPERSLSHSPLFQVMFVEHEPAEDLGLPGVSARAAEIGTGAAGFDFMISLGESDRQVRGWVEYSTELFKGETIGRMIGHYETLLSGATRDPDQRISALPLLTETERCRLLVDWNKTRCTVLESCVHQLIEAQARGTPESVAVADEDRQLTYRELDFRSNQLARYLQKLGVGPEVMVGVAVDRSVDTVVALVGILKAGGAYVPLDLEYPLQRLAFMAKDSRLRVVLTKDCFQTKLSQIGRPMLCLDSDAEVIRRESGEDVPITVLPSNSAYVTYTSGSTGVPKGVQVSHRSLVNMLLSAQKRPGISARDTILAATRLTFDVANLELFLPLITGARVVLASRETALDGTRLGKRLISSGATIFQATPSTFRLLLESGWQGGEDLKLQAAGEILTPELAKDLLKRGSSLWNLYGPTETTVYSTVFRVRSAEGPVPIGTPISNTQCYVLDRYLQPVPIGVVGELYIGGDGLARGYLNQPELTAEKFIPDPFRQHPGARLYRSGDVARYLPDGNIEFLGRLDNQVKIRGFRVELGEIEAGLERHADVKTAAVVLREDEPGQKRLVAYIVGRAGAAPTTEGLRSFLGRSLPEYMLPSRFEFLEAMPLTASGKADRRALPAPGESRPEVGAAFVAPRTELEEKLARIWCQLLRLDRVGIYDNFFDLGGHSLLATRLLSQVEKEFGKTLSLASVFRAPAIQDLAALLSQPCSPEEIPGIVPIQPFGSRPPFFCVGAGPLFRSLAQELGVHQPFLSLGLSRNETNSLPVPFKLEDMAAVLVRKLREIQPKGPYFLGGWCADGVLAYETARQLLNEGGEVALLVLFDAENPNPLANDPRAPELKRHRLFKRIGFHLKNFRRARAAKRLAYLRDLLETRIIVWKLQTWQILYKLLLYTTGHIPSRFRDFDSMEFYAMCHYHPGRCPARVVLISADLGVGAVYSDRRLGWGEVVSGELDIHSVPCGHSDLFREPHVKTLARTLDTCLAEAQAKFTTSRV